MSLRVMRRKKRWLEKRCDELTLNPSLEKRGTYVPLLLLSRRSPLSAGEKGQGMSLRVMRRRKRWLEKRCDELTLNPSLEKRGTCVSLLFVSRRSRQSGEKGSGDEFGN